jgi:RNA polymerase sigma-70 factor (ECF subfamily)
MDSPEATQKADWLRAILERFEGPLVRYALQITGDLEQARDVVQDTFLKLCGQDPAAVEGHLAQWLFTVCRNRALDVQRKERRMTPLSEVELEHRENGEPSPAAVAAQKEAAQNVLEMLDDLPPNQREVVRLKFHGQLSYQEISTITSLSVSNVGFLLHTAIKTLRARLQRLDEITDRSRALSPLNPNLLNRAVDPTALH